MAKLIWIDPGHGGRDPGNTRGGMRESDTCLDLAKRTGHYIRLLSKTGDIKSVCRVRTGMSREIDEYVGIDKRALEARRANANLLVSIHTNASINPAAKGCEILVSPDGSHTVGSSAIGGRILDRLEACGFARRGVRPAKPPWIRFKRLGLLNGVKRHMPAVLIEVGFASNSHDAALLRSPEARECIAMQIAAACVEWLGVEPRYDLVACDC